jgi:hypothetical protein
LASRSLQDYALEKLSAAVHVLATHPEEVRIRLRECFDYLAMVPSAALPHRLRSRFEDIIARLTKFQPEPAHARTDERPWGTTSLTETTRKIRKRTGARIADDIFQLTSELEYLLEHTVEPID